MVRSGIENLRNSQPNGMTAAGETTEMEEATVATER